MSDISPAISSQSPAICLQQSCSARDIGFGSMQASTGDADTTNINNTTNPDTARCTGKS